MAFKMKNTAYYKKKFTESEMASPYLKSSFTTDYKQQYQNLVNQINDLKRKKEEGVGQANIEKQIQIIQNKIRDLQSKMEKDAQHLEATGAEKKLQVFPVIPKMISKFEK